MIFLRKPSLLVKLVSGLILLFAVQNWAYALAYETTKATDHLRIVTEDWKPYSYLDSNNQLKGKTVEKVKRILAHTDIEYTMELLPWPRAYNVALTEPNILIFSIFNSKERQGKFHFICPLIEQAPQYFFKLSSRTDIELNHLNDAKDYSVGVLREDYEHTFLKNHGFEDGVNIDTYVEEESNMKKLFRGRVDLVINTIEAMNQETKQLGYSPKDVVPILKMPFDNDIQNCLALSLKTPKKIVNQIKSALLKENQLENAL